MHAILPRWIGAVTLLPWYHVAMGFVERGEGLHCEWRSALSTVVVGFIAENEDGLVLLVIKTLKKNFRNLLLLLFGGFVLM
jgi:hypothetical protein